MIISDCYCACVWGCGGAGVCCGQARPQTERLVPKQCWVRVSHLHTGESMGIALENCCQAENVTCHISLSRTQSWGDAIMEMRLEMQPKYMLERRENDLVISYHTLPVSSSGLHVLLHLSAHT